MPELNLVTHVGIDGALGDLKPLGTAVHSVAGSLLTQKEEPLPKGAHPGLAVPLQLLWETVGIAELSLRHQGSQALDRDSPRMF